MKKMFKTAIGMMMVAAALCFGACDDGGSGSNSGNAPITAPDAPGAARVTPADSQLTLEWDAVEGAAAYEVWYSETNDSATATEFTGDPDDTDLSCVITGLSNGTPYFVWLRARNTAGTSGFGDVASGTPEEALVAPDAPGAAVVTRGDGELSLAWTPVEGAAWYEVWINDENVSATAYPAPDGDHVAGTNFVVDGLDNGTPYYVWIVACNPAGDSDFGPVASGTPDIDPAAVSGLAAVTAADHVTLDWTDPVNFTLDHIEITWTPGGPAEAVSVDPGTQTCDISMTADGTARTFTVTCVFEDETGVAATIESAGVVEISTAAELDDIRNALSAHYILMVDIDLSAYASWTPIGTDSSRFTGNLDGNCHIISNITVSGVADYRGLFGCIGADGGVSDLLLKNVSVSGASHIGALAGRNYGSIVNCSATGAVTGTESYAGGLVGISDGTINMCHTACAVSGNNYVGGLVSKNNGDVSNSYAAGPVSGTQYVGGFAGHIGNDGKAQNFNRCYATGDVTGYYDVGGFLGYNYDGVVNDCYATGNVTKVKTPYFRTVGGLVGYIQSNTVSRCYATGRITGDTPAGGLAGDNDGTVTGCYYYQDPDNGIGNKTSSFSMKQQSTYTGWDFSSTWRINANLNSGYPYLVTNPLAVNGLAASTTATSVVLTWANPEAGGFARIEVMLNGSTVQTITNGSATYTATVNADGVARTFTVRTVYADGSRYDAVVCSTGYAEIRTAADLNAIRTHAEFNYVLVADIDLTGYAWTPMGFSGRLNGNGHTISHLTINTTASDQGLFSSISGTVINLGLEDVNVSGGSYVGGLAGRNYGTVSNCYTTGTVSGVVTGDFINPGSQNVGGLIGRNENGRTLGNCYSNCSVSGANQSRYIGGLVGANYYGTVSKCYATGSVSGNASSCVGGLAGYSYGTISNCYATGSVSGGTSINVGGLTGSNGDHGAINNCYATGPVSTSSTSLGGLVGLLGSNATVSNGYYDSQTTGQSDSGKGEPRTTTQMKQQSTFTGWDFTGETANGTEDIWSIDTSGSVNSGYPYLTNNH